MLHWQGIKLGYLSLALFLLWLLAYQLPLDPVIGKGLGLLSAIALLWLSEAMHVTLTALLVPLLASWLGIFSVPAALSHFANPVLFLFLGGFALAAALHAQGLDAYLAQGVIKLAGGRLSHAVWWLFLFTAFLSMWISNTATVAIMLPLALGLLRQVDAKQEPGTHCFVLLGVAYSASIGGMGALVGSPPNAIAAAYAGLGFLEWMRWGVPTMLLLLPISWLLLYLVLKPRLEHAIAADATPWQWLPSRCWTLILFAFIVGLWLFSAPLSARLGGFEQFDSWVALLALVLVGGAGLASWQQIEEQTEWGVLLLFGGGLCLSAALQQSGASLFLAQHLLAWLSGAPLWLLLLAIATFVVFLTELASNTATAALMVPLFGSMAQLLGVDAGLMAIMVALAASCAFMLPVATPPNAIVFATGRVPQRQMIRVGLRLNLVCSLLLAAMVYLFGR
ncbi:MAG: SLC13 family permease [Aeromonadaceae bacterium]